MIKLISEILKSKVILFQEGYQIGGVKELIFDPNNGDLLGFFIIGNTGSENVVPTNQIRAIGSGFVVIKDQSSLSDIDDVIKIKEALIIHPKILKEKVFTESGQYLGKVKDGTINIVDFSLEGIYVNPSLFTKKIATQLLISAKKIVEIKRDKIIVTDEFARVKGRLTGASLPVNK